MQGAASADAVPPLRIELLGGFHVAAGGGVIPDEQWRLRKAAALVKLLALAPGHRLNREQVLDLLWPELEPEAAANNLRYALHTARRTLAPPPAPAGRYIQAHGDLVALTTEPPPWVDFAAFEEAVGAARRSAGPAAYRDALTLYGGDLLPEDRFEDWAAARREQLRAVYLAALIDLAALEERDGEVEAAIETLRRAVVAEPVHEQAHAALMRLYARSGRRDHALRQYRHLVDAMRRELDAEPEPSVTELYERIRTGCLDAGGAAGALRGSAPAPTPPTNLPAAVSTFVGRERELGDLGGALRHARLVTLVGVGGCGKTRLSVEAAARLLDRYPGGAWQADLAPLADAALLPRTVAAAAGVRAAAGRTPEDALTEFLRPRRALLLLDNCEHLLDAAAVLANALLRGCPMLTVLATSRERLGLTGEVVRPVPPLSEADGVRLFEARAAAVAPGFAVTGANAGAVAEIVRRLDGIPLALELAAARVPVLSVEQIAARLDDRFRLLTGGDSTALPRQQTLRATLDWSHALLAEPERVLLRRLSAFAGGFDLDDAATVAGEVPGHSPQAPGPTADRVTGEAAGRSVEPGTWNVEFLARLVERSLVVAETRGEARRYRLLETVREYAAERLAEAGEAETVRDRHRDRFLKLAEASELAAWGGPRQKAALDRLEAEHDNLRAALAWSLQRGDGVRALRLAAALGRFWEVRGHLAEARERLAAALALAEGAPPLLRARALNADGRIALAEGDTARAARHLEESLALFRELDNPLGVATVLFGLGWLDYLRADYERAVARYEESLARFRALGHAIGAAAVLIDLGVAHYYRGDTERSTALFREALELFRAAADRRGTAWALANLGTNQLFRGDRGVARSYFEQSLALCRELDDMGGVAIAVHQLGTVARLDGDLDRAIARYREALTIEWRMGERRQIAGILENIGRVAVARDQPERALRLIAAATAQREVGGVPLPPTGRDALRETVEAARCQAGDEAADAAWAAGLAMPLVRAVEEALTDGIRSLVESDAMGAGLSA